MTECLKSFLGNEKLIFLKHMKHNNPTIIESIGTYLPPDTISTTEILEGCANKIRFPLERITGIKTRRIAGKDEFAIDLARNAVADCLSRSKYNPSDIDLLISCNISRVDGKHWLTYEPCNAIKLRKHFGFSNALAFDITNACAGMFTGLYIVSSLIASGAIRRGLVFSGEYITHLGKTAQRDIENYLDSRIACLTLGDAGAAVILEKSTEEQTGFQHLSLQSFGHYSPYCLGQAAKKGNWIMLTDSVNLTDVGMKAGAEHTLKVIEEAGWPHDEFDHLLMHQTSKLSMNGAVREINRLLEERVIRPDNTINNLEHRGNTASTSHFIALADQIRNNTIQSGDRMIFSVTASGLTVGTGLYVLDDLPDRYRQSEENPGSITKIAEETAPSEVLAPAIAKVRIESIGTIPRDQFGSKKSLDLIKDVGSNCFQTSTYERNDMGLLIYCGVYREEYVMEPAFGALVAGELNINAVVGDPNNKESLVFDIFNGAMGFLNSCYIASQMIPGRSSQTAIVVASEVENNKEIVPDHLIGLCETASAVILDTQGTGNQGFSRFLFKHQEANQDQYVVHASDEEVTQRIVCDRKEALTEKYLEMILPAIQEILDLEGLSMDEITRVFPPQISTAFIQQLSKRAGISADKCIDIAGKGPDFFTSSLPYAIAYAQENAMVQSGDIGLMISVGSGLQVGCAIYHF